MPYFDRQTIEGNALTIEYKGKGRRTEQQRQYEHDSFMFRREYGVFNSGIVTDHTKRYAIYRGIKSISPRLAWVFEQFLLPCVEQFTIVYVKARK